MKLLHKANRFKLTYPTRAVIFRVLSWGNFITETYDPAHKQSNASVK